MGRSHIVCNGDEKNFKILSKGGSVIVKARHKYDTPPDLRVVFNYPWTTNDS